jgi:hypothetical protein
VDGVFKSKDQGIKFFEAKPFGIEQIDHIQQTVRRRVLNAFVRRRYLDKVEAK